MSFLWFTIKRSLTSKSSRMLLLLVLLICFIFLSMLSVKAIYVDDSISSQRYSLEMEKYRKYLDMELTGNYSFDQGVYEGRILYFKNEYFYRMYAGMEEALAEGDYVKYNEYTLGRRIYYWQYYLAIYMSMEQYLWPQNYYGDRWDEIKEKYGYDEESLFPPEYSHSRARDGTQMKMTAVGAIMIDRLVESKANTAIDNLESGVGFLVQLARQLYPMLLVGISLVFCATTMGSESEGGLLKVIWTGGITRRGYLVAKAGGMLASCTALVLAPPLVIAGAMALGGNGGSFSYPLLYHSKAFTTMNALPTAEFSNIVPEKGRIVTNMFMSPYLYEWELSDGVVLDQLEIVSAGSFFLRVLLMYLLVILFIVSLSVFFWAVTKKHTSAMFLTLGVGGALILFAMSAGLEIGPLAALNPFLYANAADILFGVAGVTALRGLPVLVGGSLALLVASFIIVGRKEA